MLINDFIIKSSRWDLVFPPHRAAQKFNLRRKGLSGGPGGAGRLGHHSTCFRGLIEKNPPPVPPSVFHNGSRSREPQNTSQVRDIVITARVKAVALPYRFASKRFRKQPDMCAYKII